MVRQFAAHNVQMYTNKLVVYAKFLEAVKVMYANIIYIYFLPFTLTLLSLLVENYFVFFLSQAFDLNA